VSQKKKIRGKKKTSFGDSHPGGKKKGGFRGRPTRKPRKNTGSQNPDTSSNAKSRRLAIKKVEIVPTSQVHG